MPLSRRAVLHAARDLALLGIALKSGLADAAAQDLPLFADPAPFNDDYVLELARALAKKPFVEEKIALPPGLDKLTYDQYRDIRFNPDRSMWKGEKHGFSVDLFHSGFYYTTPVDIYVVTDGEQAKLNYVPDLFTFGPLVPKPQGNVDLHYSGFRLRYPINSRDYIRRVLRVPGRVLFSRRRQGPSLWAIGARPRHRHRAA